MKRPVLSIAIVCIMLFPFMAAAARVHLKNGDVVQGKVVDQNDKQVVVQTAFAKITVPKYKIKRIEYPHKAPRLKTSDLRPPVEYGWRSLLLPSWGQFAQGKPVKGLIWAGVCGGLLTATIVTYADYLNAYNEYTAFPTQRTYDVADQRRTLFNGLLIATVSCWVLNALDAFIFAPQGGGDTTTSLRSGWLPETGTWGLSFSHRF